MDLVILYSIFNAAVFLYFVKRLHGLINFYRRPRHTLTNLPSDITLEIMKVLDWHSLLKIRQTCKHLNALSRTRAVWASQYLGFATERLQQPHLEEPLEYYSAEDLERWVLVRRSADVGWARNDIKFVRHRRIDHEGVSGACIVPGGRWLLVSEDSGSVATIDLDSPTFTRRQLIPQRHGNREYIYHIAVDVESQKPSLGLIFTLVLSPPMFITTSPYQLDIWRVTLAGHGTEAYLTANCISSFQTQHLQHHVVHDVSICRNLFARTLKLQRVSYIEIFDWEKSSSSTHHKAIVFADEIIQSIRLLPGNRLLTFSNTCMKIYSFVTTDGMEVAPHVTTPYITPPLWALPLSGTSTDRGSLSRGLSDRFSTYFVLHAENMILRLIVPHSVDEAPHSMEIMKLEQMKVPTCSMGHGKSFIQYQDGSTKRLTFPQITRGDTMDVVGSCTTVTSRNYPTSVNGARLPKLDEETGRIIQDLDCVILVVDTALYYTKNIEFHWSKHHL